MPKAQAAQDLTDLDEQEPAIAVSEKPVLYDARTEQRIGITLRKNGRSYDLFHTLSPLSDRQYFDVEESLEEEARRAHGEATSDALFGPKHKLWKALATKREGYAERDDWKEKTHPTDCLQAINILLGISIQDAKAADGDELFDDDALTVIPFHTMFDGSLLTGMSHSFRVETKAEMDEFMAIENRELNPNTLASAEKLSQAERFARLGKKLLQESDGYASGSPVPGWHLAGTTRSFFLRQLSRLGKS